jgi:hypothetical protein
VLRSSASRRAASFTDVRNKRRGIQRTQSFVWKEFVISRSEQSYQRSNSSGGCLCITAAMQCPARHTAGKDYQPQARLRSRQQHFAHMRCSSGTRAVSPLYWRRHGTRLITTQQYLLCCNNNSSCCISGDYYNKSEWKLARSNIEENNTNPNINTTSLLYYVVMKRGPSRRWKKRDSKSLKGEFKKDL